MRVIFAGVSVRGKAMAFIKTKKKAQEESPKSLFFLMAG